MKKIIRTQILLLGVSFEKPEIVENFTGTEINLRKRLVELQEVIVRKKSLGLIKSGPNQVRQYWNVHLILITIMQQN